MKRLWLFPLFLSLALSACQQEQEAIQQEAEAPQRPNILWIVSEDNSPWLGSYGDQLATTPRLDALAAEATAIFHKYRIDDLAVVDSDDRPVGLIDVQDIVAIRIVG